MERIVIHEVGDWQVIEDPYEGTYVIENETKIVGNNSVVLGTPFLTIVCTKSDIEAIELAKFLHAYSSRTYVEVV
jgi:hypothetical protein